MVELCGIHKVGMGCGSDCKGKAVCLHSGHNEAFCLRAQGRHSYGGYLSRR